VPCDAKDLASGKYKALTVTAYYKQKAAENLFSLPLFYILGLTVL
jgi:hypothetical protein